MHRRDGQIVFFATDLSNFLACPQLTLLNQRAALGPGPKPPKFDDPGLDALRERGKQHEQQYLAGLRERGLKVIEIPKAPEGLSRAERSAAVTSQTVEAMKAGAEVIYQGGLFDGMWAGYPDSWSARTGRAHSDGWSYDVVDTKLARAAKGGALLQVLLYADLVAQVQGTPPEYVRLALAGPDARIESFRVAETAAYFRSVKRRFLEFVQAQHGLKPAPDPVEHCAICDWGPVCKQERREADHLSQVAGITSGQRRALVERDITTLEAFAEMPLPITPKLESVSAASLERMHAQALIQLQGRRAGAHKYELLQPVVPEQGLAALPEPSAGDLFFDLEGDPFAHVEGLEYLFGYVDRNGAYHATWALNPDDEKRAFEEFVDFVMARLEQHPDLHIYHFNHYETTALKRLMSRHGTREDEIDRLLRGRVFVDLFRVVRQGLRASVESYSIKKLEPLYGYTRDVDLRVAGTDKANFEAWLEIGGNNDETGGLRASIEGYNRDDCVSTLQLRDWLEEGRRELASLVGEEVPRPAAADPAPDEEQQQRQAEVDAVMSELMANISADAAARTPDEHARWLLAQLLEFHRREKKPYWWSYYHRLTLSEGPCSHGSMLPCSWGRASRGTIASPASTPAAAGV